LIPPDFCRGSSFPKYKDSGRESDSTLKRNLLLRKTHDSIFFLPARAVDAHRVFLFFCLSLFFFPVGLISLRIRRGFEFRRPVAYLLFPPMLSRSEEAGSLPSFTFSFPPPHGLPLVRLMGGVERPILPLHFRDRSSPLSPLSPSLSRAVERVARVKACSRSFTVSIPAPFFSLFSDLVEEKVKEEDPLFPFFPSS